MQDIWCCSGGVLRLFLHDVPVRVKAGLLLRQKLQNRLKKWPLARQSQIIDDGIGLTTAAMSYDKCGESFSPRVWMY